MTASVTCGKCRFCYNGLLMLCEERLSIGSGVNGAFTEYLVIPARLAFHVPENVSLEAAALSEPLACVVRGVIEMSSVKPGDYVLVSGPGTIGLLTMQLAKLSGARVMVFGTQTDTERLDFAMELGADAIANIDAEDMNEAASAFTNGEGFDVVFECAGVAASADTCLKLVRKTGLYSQVALFGKKIDFDLDLLLKKELKLTSSYASERSSWETAIRLLEQNRISVEPLVSAKLPLDSWKEAFEMVMNKTGFKILLMPNSADGMNVL